MKKIAINEDVIKEQGLTIPQFFAMMLVKVCDEPIKEIERLHIEGKTIEQSSMKGTQTYLFPKYDDVVCNVWMLSDKRDYIAYDKRIDKLSRELMEIFPEGRKENLNNSYWRGNRREITMQLKKFMKVYGDWYTDDQIKAATQRYVDSFNGDYTYMRLLKYFIWKIEVVTDSNFMQSIVETSDLATILENQEVDPEHWREKIR